VLVLASHTPVRQVNADKHQVDGGHRQHGWGEEDQPQQLIAGRPLAEEETQHVSGNQHRRNFHHGIDAGVAQGAIKVRVVEQSREIVETDEDLGLEQPVPLEQAEIEHVQQRHEQQGQEPQRGGRNQ
jgi:hypothetical protein